MMNKKMMRTTHNEKNERRLSYLLRLWRTEAPEQADWQASLEIPGTGKRIGFANLEQLFAYLMDLTEADCGKQGAEDRP